MTAEQTFGSISPKQQERLDKLCDHFEAKLGGEKRPRIEAYLEKVAEPYRAILLRELLLLELDHARNTGNLPQQENYQQRFPDYLQIVEAAFDNPGQETQVGNSRTIAGNNSEASGNTDDIPPQIGRYQVERKLGGGAFGIVYLATDDKLDRKVAVKVLRPGLLNSDNAVKRFLREAKASARLQHPNIVPVFDTGEPGETLYIASAFVDGRELSKVRETETLDCRRAVEIVRKLASALDYAHRLGIVHRDIKPDNIRIDKNDEPHLMDFGLAQLTDSAEKMTRAGVIMGTPAYMPPEQIGSPDKATHAADQYSLGVILYELLTGETPFHGTLDILMFNIQTQTPPTPRSINESIPRDLETICLKTMSKEPEARYGSCASLANDLQCWLDDRPIHARRQTIAERFWKWCRREKAIAVSLFVAVFCLFGLAIGASVSAAYLSAAAIREESLRKTAEENESSAIQNETKVKRLLTEVTIEKKNAETAAARALKSERQAKNNYNDLLKANREKDLAEQKATQAGRRALTAEEERNLAMKQASDEKQRAEEELARSRIAQRYANRLGYNLKITLAAESIEQKDKEFADEVLNRCLEDYRGFEWFALKQQCQQEPIPEQITATKITLTRGPYQIVQFHGETERIVGVNENTQAIRVWDSGTSDIAFKIPKEFRSSRTAPSAFTADGRWFYFRSGTKEVTCLDTKTSLAISPSLKGHDAVIRRIAVNNDGTRVATGDSSGNIILWSGTSRQEMKQFHGQKLSISALRFVNDGQSLLSAAEDGRVVRWNLNSGDNKQVFDFRSVPGKPKQVVLSPAGDRMLIGMEEGHIVLAFFDEQSTRVELTGHESLVTDATFSRSGERIATVDVSGRVLLWDAVTGRILLHLDCRLPSSPSQPPAGSASKPMPPQRRIPQQYRIGFDKDGASLSVVSPTQVIRWTPKSAVFVRHYDGLSGVIFGPRGNTLIAHSTIRQDSRNKYIPEIRHFKTARGPIPFTFPDRTRVNLRIETAAFSSDSRLLAFFGGRGICVCDYATGIVVRNFDTKQVGARALAFCNRDSILMTAGGGIDCYDWKNGRHMPELTADPGADRTSFVGQGGLLQAGRVAKFDPSGRLLAIPRELNGDGIVQIWNVSNIPKLTAHAVSCPKADEDTAVSFSRPINNSQFLAATTAISGKTASKVVVWKLSYKSRGGKRGKGQLLATGHMIVECDSATFVANGSHILTIGENSKDNGQAVDIWNLTTKRRIRVIDRIRNRGDITVSSNPADSRYFATSIDNEVRVWYLSDSVLSL